MKYQIATYKNGNHCNAMTKEDTLDNIVAMMDPVLEQGKAIGKFDQYLVFECMQVGMLKDVPQSPAIYNSKEAK